MDAHIFKMCFPDFSKSQVFVTKRLTELSLTDDLQL